MHIDDSRYDNPFKGTNLCACVDSIGKPLHVKYDGGRCLLIETDCETVCAKFAGPEECGCDFPLAGFMSVMLADIVDYGEYKLGVRNQSLTFSMKGFLQKMAFYIQL